VPEIIKSIFYCLKEILAMNEKLVGYHKELLGDEFPLFQEWVEKPLRKSVRVNTIRTSIAGFKEELDRMGAKPIPWCAEGFWVDDKPWGATIPYLLGYYYIQEAASMIPAEALGLEAADVALDVAAAPGSKASQMAPRCRTLVANEPSADRRKVLFSNLNRCGVMNGIITGYDGTRFPRVKFDKILVDAPCSNMGTARKDGEILKEWTPRMAAGMAPLQKRLLRTAFSLLKPDGKLVYSTCTTAVEENEEVVLDLLKDGSARIEKIDLKVKSRPGLLEGTKDCMRIYPWDNDTEFFFVAKISKK
jgi:NOL1/NOP2/sun family putative RNA methylase